MDENEAILPISLLPDNSKHSPAMPKNGKAIRLSKSFRRVSKSSAGLFYRQISLNANII